MLDVAIFELFISPLTEPIMYTYVLYFYVFHCLYPSTHGRNGLSRVVDEQQMWFKNGVKNR